jgi:predicted NBD/HSP70 family sugar kinase
MALKGDNMVRVKQSNRSAILNLLHEEGKLSRKRIAKKLMLTPAAITLLIGDMIKEGLLREGETLPGAGSAGRKEVVVEINSRNFASLGVSINLHDIIISAVYLDGTVLFHKSLPNDHSKTAEELVDYIADELDKLVKENNLERNRIVGLGVAIRGIVDLERKISIHSFGALRESNVPLYKMFEEKTGYRITMDNNVRSLSEAHIFMFRKPRPSSMLFLRSEIGIGGAVTINSETHLGGNGKCSELGHTPVVKNGKLCKCGKRGCLETIASPEAIENEAKAIYSPDKTPQLYKLTGGNIGNVTFDTIVDAALGGDEKIEKIIRNAIIHLADVLKVVIYTIDPQYIVLYGKMFRNKIYFNWLNHEMKIGMDDYQDTIIKESQFNMTLEDKCAGILAVRAFYNEGGIRRFTGGSKSEEEYYDWFGMFSKRNL